MVLVNVNTKVLKWACDRADPNRIRVQYPRLDDWISNKKKPTLKQLERYSRSTHTPIGYFFLDNPPSIEIPIPDYRTIANKKMKYPSPDLLETIFICQQRQEWFRDHVKRIGLQRVYLVGSGELNDDVTMSAMNMRDELGINDDIRSKYTSWTDALRDLIDRVESAGILVMINGVVGTNNHRKLDPDEFRGFALVDDLAPLIFINGSDTKAAQIFTLTHELAHIWIGKAGISDTILGRDPNGDVEDWCNRCAAEFLVPEVALREMFDPGDHIPDEVDGLARTFKVSSIVILRRLLDLDLIESDEYWELFNDHISRFKVSGTGQGGNFYNTMSIRVGKRFGRAIVANTLEGQTLYKDAFRLLGFSKLSTFEEFGRRLGVG